MATKPRTRRMSFVLPRKFDDSTIEYLRNHLDDFNGKERENEIQRSEAGTRFAPIYILEVRCLPGDEDTTLCLLHTNGSQFQFTRWYEFLIRSLGFVERMDQNSKLKQIEDFSTRMRHLDERSVLRFDVPGQRTPTKKRGSDDGEAVKQTPSKQLVLSTPEKSYPPVATRLYGSSSTVMLQQTVLTGASQPSSSQLGDEPLLSQHRAAGEAGGPVQLNVFVSSGDAVAKLCDFLVGKYATYKSFKSVHGRREGESAEVYRERMRGQLNSTPTVAKIIGLFLPPILQPQRFKLNLYTMFSHGHADLLVALHRMFTKGVYAPSMTPDSQELTYRVDCFSGREMTRGSCFLELWRRALKLEGALADLLKFLLKIVECVVPSALKTVAIQTHGNLRTLLASGAGLYGGGSAFWTPRSMACLEKLNEGGDPKVQETVDWLSRNRVNAFSALSPFIEELHVLLPTLAQVATLRDDLCHLDDPNVAQEVFDAVNEDRKSRLDVYTSCCGWLVVYGGKLTWCVIFPRYCLREDVLIVFFCRLVGQVHVWCNEFESIARELRMEKPGKLGLLSLSEDGKIIGLNGRPLERGHVDADCEDGLLPFPDCCMSVKPLPMETLAKMSKEYSDFQDGMLQAMVLSPGIAEALAALVRKDVIVSDLHAVKCMRRGVENIASWLKDDSHTKMQTCYLPATASMPEAIYSPDEIYKVK